MTTHSSPCFCNKVPPTPSLEVSLSSQNKPSGVGAFKTGGQGIQVYLLHLWSLN